MKIGVIPPVPMEPFSASPHEAANLWSTFFLARDREAWVETARLAGFPDNFSLWARCLYGMVFETATQTVYYPEPGLPKEVARVLQLLSEQDVRVVPFSFPILRNEGRLRDELAKLFEGLEVAPGVLETVLARWSEVRTSLRRFDGLQQRSAGFSSREYVSMLAQCMDPRRDVESIRREVEAGILTYQDVGRDRWTRVGILGLTPYREGFYEMLEKHKAVVVYDEWGVENNPMATATDLVNLYNRCPLPYGLKRRQERALREIVSRRIRGIILGVEYMCENIRDEGFFRANLGLPVLVLESARGVPLADMEAHQLERFLSECGRS